MAKSICSIPGCSKSAWARGWCGTHYQRWRKHGDPGGAELLHRGSAPAPPCSVDGCTSDAVAKGMCPRHRQNLRNYGHAVPVREWPLEDRLNLVGWDVTDRGCWEWRGALNDSGYGMLNKARAHRLVWELHNGPVPDGLLMRHKCDNPPCVNPDHLEPGTVADNSQDMVERNRSLAYSTGRYGGVCIKGLHDVTQPGALKRVTKRSGKSYLTCVGCDQERKAKWYEKKRRAAARTELGRAA